jgi:hypothetical protein
MVFLSALEMSEARNLSKDKLAVMRDFSVEISRQVGANADSYRKGFAAWFYLDFFDSASFALSLSSMPSRSISSL